MIPIAAMCAVAPLHSIHTTVTIARANERRLLLVPVMINGKGPFQFFLDTGAPTTVLSDRFAASQQIQADGTTSGHGATGAISISTATVGSVDVGAAHRDAMKVGIVANFDELHRRVPNVVGSLGLDFLRDYTMEIDYVHNTVTLANDIHVAAGDPNLPFEIGAGLYADVKINGQGPFPFVIDTGASVHVLDPRIASELSLPTRAATSLPGAGGNSAVPARVVELESLAAGPYMQQGGSAVVADIFGPLRTATKRPFVGILGYPFFGERTVTFDFPNRRLALK
jgi:predicted aspartyl protease